MSTPDPSSVLGIYIREQCDAIAAADVSLRDRVDQVHQTRVAIRRLRSTLRVFDRLFEPSGALLLNRDLAWYAGLLGAVRDRQVQRAHLHDAIALLPAELVVGPVATKIDEHLLAEQRLHVAELTHAMDSKRYQALQDSLRSWARLPAYREDPDDTELIERLARRAAHTARQRLAVALDATDPEELHRARKAAKRARYAAELTRPLGGEKTEDRVRHFKLVQDALGAHQDSILAADLLRRLGTEAGAAPGDNGFTYGLMCARELQAAEHARETAATL